LSSIESCSLIEYRNSDTSKQTGIGSLFFGVENNDYTNYGLCYFQKKVTMKEKIPFLNNIKKSKEVHHPQEIQFNKDGDNYITVNNDLFINPLDENGERKLSSPLLESSEHVNCYLERRADEHDIANNFSYQKQLYSWGEIEEKIKSQEEIKHNKILLDFSFPKKGYRFYRKIKEKDHPGFFKSQPYRSKSISFSISYKFNSLESAKHFIANALKSTLSDQVERGSIIVSPAEDIFSEHSGYKKNKTSLMSCDIDNPKDRQEARELAKNNTSIGEHPITYFEKYKGKYRLKELLIINTTDVDTMKKMHKKFDQCAIDFGKSRTLRNHIKNASKNK
jgi:hypothetical protein